MALLGTPLVVLLACLAVLLPVGTFLMWSRVRGPGPVRAVSRLGMLLTGQLATVLLLAALANDYGDFYGSWSDLVGTGSAAALHSYGATSATTSGGASGAARAQSATGSPGGNQPGGAGSMRVLGSTNWSSPSQRSSRGEVESVAFTGRTSGLSAQGYVYLPPQYFEPKWSHTRFPAVEVLTGYPGAAVGLVNRMNYPGVALGLVEHRRAVPMIYVMLDPTVAPPRDTECTDVPNGPQVQTFLAREVPSAVQSALRVKPADWGIAGDSTGGYCAAKILMTHSATFRAGVSLSGYYYARHDVTTGSLWDGSRALRHVNSPEWLLAHYEAPPVSLFVTSSKQETRPDGYPDTERF
ncbi:MAG: alpha/beta hydrolase, partial [Nocardioidaceae bacterium]